jgi:hypothetical protein
MVENNIPEGMQAFESCSNFWMLFYISHFINDKQTQMTKDNKVCLVLHVREIETRRTISSIKTGHSEICEKYSST